MAELETEEDEEELDEEAQEASILIVSDFVCPWCYIGMVEVERLKLEYDFSVRFAPFYLHPETPPEGMPARRILAPEDPPSAIEQRAEGLGIKFARGRKWTSNSYLALQASQFAYEQGADWRFHRRMLKAYFEDLENIGELDTVVRVGADAGLNEPALRAALEEGHYRERVDEGIAWTRDIGVTAVPTFVFNGRYAMVGAHELDAFRQVMKQIGQPPRS